MASARRRAQMRVGPWPAARIPVIMKPSQFRVFQP
jgi:hypothetical protein